MSDPVLTGLASDFRRQLIIDRYSSVLSRLPLRRQVSLAEPGSRDARIWNVFRTLEQIDPSRWLPRLLGAGTVRPDLAPGVLEAGVALTLWKRIKAPPERLAWLRRGALHGEVRPPVGRRRKGRVVPLSQLRAELKARAQRKLPLEDPVEVDVIIKTPGSVVFVEIPGPGQSPDEPAASDANRTLLLRLIDAGLAYAEARTHARRHPITFSLLVLPEGEATERLWVDALRRLASSPSRLRRGLPHRGPGFDPSSLVSRLGAAGWPRVESLLASLRREATDPLESMLLDRLLQRIGFAGSPAGLRSE